MEWQGWTFAIVVALDVALRIGLSIRVIMRRRNTGVSLSWLIVILTFPFVGAAAYWLVGENHVGLERARRETALRGPYDEWRARVRERVKLECADLDHDSRRLARQIESTSGMPLMPGNTIELIDVADEVMNRIIADIDAARSTAHFSFYIWEPGGKADEVVAALLRALQRGVKVRILVDEIGAAAFLLSDQPRLLREAGAQVVAALPVGFVRSLFTRMDLRNHRKTIVIDSEVAYIGSQNLVDPHLFKKENGIGEWVDTMARVRGCLVEAFGVCFIADWELETGEGVGVIAESAGLRCLSPEGTTCAQLLPSGPGIFAGVFHAALLSAIYQARRELIITTPYFVPDEAVQIALLTAVRRGVRVLLIIPKRVDSRLVGAANRAHFQELLEAGVEIAQYRRAMLHGKNIVIDDRIGMVGTCNIDQRSFFLNFEITLVGYDTDFVHRLREQQLKYAAGSVMLSATEWRKRPFLIRLVENATGLVSPLL